MQEVSLLVRRNSKCDCPEVNQDIATAISSTPSVQVVHPYNLLCGKQTCELVSNGHPLFWDVTHLSADGAELVGAGIEPSIANSLRIAGAVKTSMALQAANRAQ
jgi:hypothetical protein